MIARLSAIGFLVLGVGLLCVGGIMREVEMPQDLYGLGTGAAEIAEVRARGAMLMWLAAWCIPLACLFGSLAEIQHQISRRPAAGSHPAP